MVDIVLHHSAGHGLDAAYACGRGTLADDAYHAYVARVGHMRAAAQFHGIAVAHHAHVLAVFFAEQSHGSHFACFGDGHMAVLVESYGLADAVVGEVFHAAYFFGGEFLEVAEVEAQRVGADVAATLFHVLAEHFAERLVQQVRGRVVAFRGRAGLGVDGCYKFSGRVGGEFFGKMHSHAVLALGVVDLHHLAGGGIGEGAAVAGLSAHLGVERRAREHYLIIFAALLTHMAVAEHAGGSGHFVVAAEFLLAAGEFHPVGCLHGGGIARTLFLGSHFRVKLLAVKGHALLFEDEQREVKRKAVCVV